MKIVPFENAVMLKTLPEPSPSTFNLRGKVSTSRGAPGTETANELRDAFIVMVVGKMSKQLECPPADMASASAFAMEDDAAKTARLVSILCIQEDKSEYCTAKMETAVTDSPKRAVSIMISTIALSIALTVLLQSAETEYILSR